MGILDHIYNPESLHIINALRIVFVIILILFVSGMIGAFFLSVGLEIPGFMILISAVMLGYLMYFIAPPVVITAGIVDVVQYANGEKPSNDKSVDSVAGESTTIVDKPDEKTETVDVDKTD